VPANVTAVPIPVNLPVWNPGQTPELAPPARTSQWSARIGVPGAIFLGRIRPRLIGAVVCALFIPVGAVRAVILVGVSNRSATDPWGPADAFVIVAAVIGFVLLLRFVRSARNARTNAAHSAQVVLRQSHPDVSQAEIAPLLVSMKNFDEWARARNIRPFAENATAANASAEGSRLMYARSVRGRYSLWVPRFGEQLARAFRVTRIQAWTGMVLVVGSVLFDGAAATTVFILSQQGDPGAPADLPGFQLPVVASFAIGWLFILLARYAPRGRYAILNAMLPTLVVRDPKLSRDMIGAMFAKPYMYDMWVREHPTV
jgi:hypothetical protein